MPIPRMHRKRLYELRTRAGLTQEQCADIVGVSRRTWIRYEDGSGLVPHRVATLAKTGFPHPEDPNPLDLEAFLAAPPTPFEPETSPPRSQPLTLARRLIGW